MLKDLRNNFLEFHYKVDFKAVGYMLPSLSSLFAQKGPPWISDTPSCQR
jgi:hypothetical protein